MSIVDGQRVRALESNAAWASKQANNTFLGIQTLSNLTSGPSVANVQLAINNLLADILLKIDLAEKGAPNGVATLDALGKVPLSQIPDSLIGAVNYQGTWDASTNTPFLEDATGEKGHYYVVSAAGSQDLGSGSIDFDEFDWVIHNGSVWERLDTDDGLVGHQEVPGGVVDGINTVFGPLTYVPTSSKSLTVYLDGLIVDDTEWSYSGGYITFDTAPNPGQSVYVFYVTEGLVLPPPVFSNVLKTEYRVITSGEETAKALTLTQTPIAPSEVVVDWFGGGGAGVGQWFGDDFTVTGTTLSWNGLGLDGLLVAGDKLRITYVY